jgi:hypothetical protein
VRAVCTKLSLCSPPSVVWWRPGMGFRFQAGTNSEALCLCGWPSPQRTRTYPDIDMSRCLAGACAVLHASIRVVSLSSRPGLTGPTKGKGKKLRQSNPVQVQVQRMFPSGFAWQVHCMGPCVLLTAMVDDAVLCRSLQLR